VQKCEEVEPRRHRPGWGGGPETGDIPGERGGDGVKSTISSGIRKGERIPEGERASTKSLSVPGQ